MTNIEVSEAVRLRHQPADPSSQIVCSIGGNVAENSGGAHASSTASPTNYVTGLEVVLPDGEMMCWRPRARPRRARRAPAPSWSGRPALWA